MTQAEFIEKHGNPQMFEAAIWRAWAALEITTDEACKALEDYARDYKRLAEGHAGRHPYLGQCARPRQASIVGGGAWRMGRAVSGTR